MKTQRTIQQLCFSLLLMAGLNLFSSCESCSHKTENTEENTTETNTYESTSEEDTVSTGDESASSNDGSTTSASIKASSGSGSSKSGNASGTSTSTMNATKTSTAVNNTKKEEAKQQAITDMVENSDAKSAVGKDGKPIRSSGDAGTGSGTGTGSTGNNSRVTTREAQKAN